MAPVDALGYRARISILLPASNTIGEPECAMLAPVGVTNQTVRLAPTPAGANVGNLETYRGGLAAKVPPIEDAIRVALQATPKAIILAHAMDTFRGGVAGAKAMHEALLPSAKDVPVIIPSLAYLDAFAALGLKPGARIAGLTPYWPKEDEDLRGFLVDAGYQVTRVLGLKCNGGAEIAAVTEPQIVTALRELAADSPQAIVLPGTNMASTRIADQASIWLGVPVLCCNTVCYWSALRTAGIQDRMSGFGPLLAKH
jgi:maleate isomerase